MNNRAELTIRGLIIGIIITLVFTAANVYFGLKAGLTFSTSIPAAVISMAILRYFRDATVQENNIVQTVASAEVLKVGSGDEGKDASDIEHGRAGLLAVLWGSIVAAVFAVIVATQVFAADVAQAFRMGKRGAVSGYDFFLSFALLGIGHFVGLSVGIAMLIGAFIGWGGGVPHF